MKLREWVSLQGRTNERGLAKTESRQWSAYLAVALALGLLPAPLSAQESAPAEKPTTTQSSSSPAAETTPPATEPAKPAPDAARPAADEPVAKPQTVLKPVIEDKVAPMSEAQVYKHLLKSSAWVVLKGSNTGTGWVADAEKKLLVTNHHVISKSSGVVEVYFPNYTAGELNKDPQHYLEEVSSHKGVIVFSEPKKDLAVIHVPTLPDNVPALKIAAASASPGDRVHAVAAHATGSQGMWPYANGAVRQVTPYKVADLYEGQAVETQVPINFGNSGGAVVNDLGEVVAVVMARNSQANLVSLFIDCSEVRKLLEKVSPLAAPESGEQFLTRADNHYYAYRYELAMNDYTKALDLNPKLTIASVRQGWIFFHRGDHETALAEFNSILKEPVRIGEAYHGRALVLRALGKSEEALADVTEAIRLSPNTTGSLRLRGELHLAAGQANQALSDFIRAVKLAPSNPENHVEVGRAFDTLGQPEQSVVAYGNAIKQNDQVPRYYISRGNALRRLQRFDEAIEDYKKAIELDPNPATPFSEWGFALLLKNDFQTATKVLDTAVQRDAKSTPAHMYRGMALRRLGRLADAERDLQTAVNLSPNDPGPVNELGVVWFFGKRFDLADQAFARSIQLNPKNPLYHQNRGETLHMLKKPELATEELSAAISLQPANATLYALRGITKYEAKDAAGSAADYQKAIELSPQQYALAKTKWIEVSNRTEEPLKVFFNCYTTSKDGSWNWFPRAPGAKESYELTLAPGETQQLNHGEWKAHSSKMRLWAVGTQTKREWTTYKTTDLETAPEGGYLAAPDKRAVFSYSFP